MKKHPILLALLLAAFAQVSFAQQPATDAAPTETEAQSEARKERLRKHEERIKEIIEIRRIEREKAGLPEQERPETGRRVTQIPAKRVTIQAEAQPISVIAKELEKQIGVPVRVHGEGADPVVTIMVRDVRLEPALRMMLEQLGWRYWMAADGSVEIGTAADHEKFAPRRTQRGAAGNPGSNAPRVTLLAEDQPLGSILAQLSELTGASITAKDIPTSQTATIIAQDMRLESVLTTLAVQNDCVWWKLADGSIEMGTKEGYMAEQSIHLGMRVFRAKEGKASEVAEQIKQFLTPRIGSVISDDRMNKIIVTDTPAVITSIIEKIPTLGE